MEWYYAGAAPYATGLSACCCASRYNICLDMDAPRLRDGRTDALPGGLTGAPADPASLTVGTASCPSDAAPQSFGPARRSAARASHTFRYAARSFGSAPPIFGCAARPFGIAAMQHDMAGPHRQRKGPHRPARTLYRQKKRRPGSAASLHQGMSAHHIWMSGRPDASSWARWSVPGVSTSIISSVGFTVASSR